jgi:hypothetical protein
MSNIDGAHAPKGHSPISQVHLSAPPKVAPSTIDTTKDTFNALTSSPSLGPGASLMKLVGNLGLSGFRVWNQASRQQDLQSQFHEVQSSERNYSDYFSTIDEGVHGHSGLGSTAPMMKEFDTQRQQIETEAHSQIKTAAYDVGKDLATIGPLAKKFPAFKFLFGGYEIGTQVAKVNSARNEKLHAKGELESHEHLMKLLDRPMNSGELDTYSKLRSTMLDKEVQFNQQVISSICSGGKSILDMTPFGDIATGAMLVHKHTGDQPWQDTLRMINMSPINTD